MNVVEVLLFITASVPVAAVLTTDPAALTCGKNCKPELIAANRVRLGYDKPIYEQYWQFIKGIFAGRTYGSGDIAFTCPAPSLGYSFNQHECVSTLIGKTFPVTAFLSLGAFILWMLLGVGTGTFAALNTDIFIPYWYFEGEVAFFVLCCA